jgi:hypothetical protein
VIQFLPFILSFLLFCLPCGVLHRCPLILLLPHPPPPSSVGKLSLFLSLHVCRQFGEGGLSKLIRRRESLVLYKSFHTLCSLPFLTLTLPISLTPLLSPSSPPPPPPMDYLLPGDEHDRHHNSIHPHHTPPPSQLGLQGHFSFEFRETKKNLGEELGRPSHVTE